MNEQEMKTLLILFERFFKTEQGISYYLKLDDDFKKGPYKLYKEVIKNKKTDEKEVIDLYEKLYKRYLDELKK